MPERKGIRAWAMAIKRDVLTVWLAARDSRVPWYVKGLALCVAGYALSPIDLIPDFIPVLGFLDDLLLIPSGVYLVVRLIPVAVAADLRKQAAERLAQQRPVSFWGAAVIILIWGTAAVTTWYAVWG